MKRPSLLIIFLSVFIDLVGFGIVMPLLPIYSKRFGASGFEIGMIIASFSVMQFLFAPFWGRLSDRIGRRPVILISNAGSAISYALFAVASTMTGSVGLCCSWRPGFRRDLRRESLVANAFIADITPGKADSAKGLIGMAFGFGFIFGPALGAFTFARFGLPGPADGGGVLRVQFLLGVSCWLKAGSRVRSRAGPARAPPNGAHIESADDRFVIGIYFLRRSVLHV